VTLLIAHQAERAAELHIRRGGPPTGKPAGGHPPALSLAEKTLVTVLRLRFHVPQHVLADLFGVVTGTIGTAQRQMMPLLDRRGHLVVPAGPSLTTTDRSHRVRRRGRAHPHPDDQGSVLIIGRS